jgi:hypothetical protein
VNFFQNEGNAWPKTCAQFGMKNFLNVFTTLFFKDLNFKGSKTHILNLIVYDCGTIATRTFGSQVSNLLVLFCRNRFDYNLDQWKLFSNGTL